MTLEVTEVDPVFFPRSIEGLNAYEEALVNKGELWNLKRESWLSGVGRGEDDVQDDDKGEYVMVDYEQEDNTSMYVKRYLPEELQAFGNDPF